jgi:hypothetical protein
MLTTCGSTYRIGKFSSALHQTANKLNQWSLYTHLLSNNLKGKRMPIYGNLKNNAGWESLMKILTRGTKSTEMKRKSSSRQKHSKS